jgi:hypothetical protein
MSPITTPTAAALTRHRAVRRPRSTGPAQLVNGSRGMRGSAWDPRNVTESPTSWYRMTHHLKEPYVRTETTLLDCPAFLDDDNLVRCGLPAEVEYRHTVMATAGPLDMVKISCPRRHWFIGPSKP